MRRAWRAALAALLAFPAAAQAQGPDAPVPDTVAPERFGMRPPDLAYGAFQRGRYLTALELARPRAEAGDAAAQTLLGEIYSRGLGVRRDQEAAAQWYGRAAEQGETEARFQLAMILLGGGMPERERAYELMRAAADGGNPQAQFNFAQLVLQRDPTPRGLESALAYYGRAAQAGIPDAQYAVARAHAEGAGGWPVDRDAARRWMERAARANFDTAQVELGTWLVEGGGGVDDEEAGFGWLMRAARSGNVAARNRVAKLYRAGIGVEPDAVAAAAWYMAARRGGLVDPLMEDHLAGLTEDEIAQARERAAPLGP